VTCRLERWMEVTVAHVHHERSLVRQTFHHWRTARRFKMADRFDSDKLIRYVNHSLRQGWATYGPRRDFDRPADCIDVMW
jgi:hypothetical protein